MTPEDDMTNTQQRNRFAVEPVERATGEPGGKLIRFEVDLQDFPGSPAGAAAMASEIVDEIRNSMLLPDADEATFAGLRSEIESALLRQWAGSRTARMADRYARSGLNGPLRALRRIAQRIEGGQNGG